MKNSILDRIFETRKAHVAAVEKICSLTEMQERAIVMGPARDFASALRDKPYSLIAEVKKGSPSGGVFEAYLDPVEKATYYAGGGASAISVVTEPEFFYGAVDWPLQIRRVVEQPLLQKDFIFSAYQIWEAKAMGADAVLLILAKLDDKSAASLMATAAEAGISCLVEVHDKREAKRAGSLGAAIVGVNNRDLKTFEVSLETSERLIDTLPPNAIKVSESGITTAADCARLSKAGYDAFLIGEALVTAGDPAKKLLELRGGRAAG